MQAHISREYERLTRIARETENERAYQADLAQDAERERESAYMARVTVSLARGESEEAFEQREIAAQAAEYRITDRVNREICEIFAAAGIASDRFFRAEEKRAA